MHENKVVTKMEMLRCSNTTPTSRDSTVTSSISEDVARVDVSQEDVDPHDVLCGRGQSTYSHPGNENFRNLVEERRQLYLNAGFKSEKRIISGEIVQIVHSLNPAGRFLTKVQGSARRKRGQSSAECSWQEISYGKAREKACQALREGAPSIRKEFQCKLQFEPRPLSCKENIYLTSVASPSYVQPSFEFSHDQSQNKLDKLSLKAKDSNNSPIRTEHMSNPLNQELSFTKEESDFLVEIMKCPDSTPQPWNLPRGSECQQISTSAADPSIKNLSLIFKERTVQENSHKQSNPLECTSSSVTSLLARNVASEFPVLENALQYYYQILNESKKQRIGEVNDLF